MDTAEWLATISKMTEDYIHFLRSGVTCACGALLQQPLLRAPTVHTRTHLSAHTDTGAIALDGASPRAARTGGTDLTIDLTADDDAADEAAAARKAVAAAYARAAAEKTHAHVLMCESCGGQYCVACGVKLEPSAGVDAADGGDDAVLDLAGDSQEEVLDLTGGDAMARLKTHTHTDAHTHARECHLRYVHATATSMERLRRVYLGTESTLRVVASLEALLRDGSFPGSGRRRSVRGTKPLSAQLQHAAEMFAEGSGPNAGDSSDMLREIAALAVEMERQAAGPASAASAAHQHAMAYAYAHSYGQGRGSTSSGTGYAGGVDDAWKLQQAEHLRKFQNSVRDRVLRSVFQNVTNHFPRTVCAPNGWEPIERVLIDDSAIDEAPSVVILNDVPTDAATDHPLLLQMLLLPGFADGMALAVGDTYVEAAASGATASGARGRGRGRPRGRATGAVPVVEDEDAFNSSGLLTASSLRALIGDAVQAASKSFGSGNGLTGGSIFHRAVSEVLRTSVMDMGMKSKTHRELFFSLLQVIPALSQHPDVAAILLFREEDASAGATGRAVGSGAPTTVSFCAWSGPAIADLSKSAGTCPSPPPGSIAFLLQDLHKQATIFLKNSTKMSGSAEVLVGDASEDAEFTAVTCLARDVEAAAERSSDSLRRFHLCQRALLLERGALDPASSSSPARMTSMDRKRARMAGAAASASASASSAALASDDADLRKLIPVLPHIAAGVKDPTTPDINVGLNKVGFTPLPAAVRRYEDFMRTHAFDTMENLKALHAFSTGAAAASGATSYMPYAMGAARTASSSGVGAASMKRHMRVSAELAQMPDLATHWASSILVRQDEASMDYLRVMMSGPADTPYANGAFFFDVVLPQEYPDVSPKVLFLTTGGGSVRFNPNLYAEGKVCLSLLGTWAGPGWIAGTSTLSQVLLSVQGQIFVDVPFANEPGFEAHVNTPSGRRAVARHNIYLHLATLKYAMLDQLKSPPAGFEHVVRGHFFFKKDEITHQAALWLTEAYAFAAYEAALHAKMATAKADFHAASRLAVPAPEPPPAAGKKRPRSSGAPAQSEPARRAQLALTQCTHAITRWQAESSIHSHYPFRRPVPKGSKTLPSFPGWLNTAMAAVAGVKAGAYAASAAATAAAGGMATAADVAKATEAVVAELLAELATLKAAEFED